MSLDEALGRLEKLIAEVRQTSLTDDKTVLGSAMALRQEARLINEGASSFDLIVFGDLDDFKHLNDEHGHEAGDVAINKVGDAIHKIVSEGLQGKAFRQSGDEFVLLLKHESVEAFLSAASALSGVLFSFNEKELRTAMSLGYVRSDGKTSFNDLQERAEIACQHAKTHGNKTVIEWTEDLKHDPLVRIGGRCRKCDARITCNMPKKKAPAVLNFCPCCGESI
jgi:diguanylate cyclase (GGDEF)-like protein